MPGFGDTLDRIIRAWTLRQGLSPVTEAIATPSLQEFSARYSDGRSILLHVGCGQADRRSAGPGFQGDNWREIRLDVDASAAPDIVGTVLEMTAVSDHAVDAVFSSHTLEHLYAHEIPVALSEFLRVIKPDGVAVSVVPDLQAAAEMIAQDRLFDPAYESAAGTITPFDIVYSYRGFVGRDKPYMAHHSGFTLRTLVDAFKGAGFGSVIGVRRPGTFDLWVLATPRRLQDEALRALGRQFLPA